MQKVLGALLALICSAATALAQVPNFPQTLPANSVVGRLGIGSGPSQAIPFATFTASLFTIGHGQIIANYGSGGVAAGSNWMAAASNCPTWLSKYEIIANTSAAPTATSLVMWDGTTCVPVGTLNETAHTFLAAGVANGVATYATRAQAIAASIDPSVTTVELDGYSSGGDNGYGAFYVRIATTTAAAWRFTSADGQMWGLSNRILTPEMFGAVGDGATDDTTALQSVASYITGFDLGATVNFRPSATYAVWTSSPVASQQVLFDLSNVNGLTVNYNGGKIVTPATSFSGVDYVWYLRNNNNNIILNDPHFEATGFTNTDNTKGVIHVNIVDNGGNLVINNIYQVAGLAAVSSNRTSASARFNGIALNSGYVQSAYYGINTQKNGDNLVANNIAFNQLPGRAYFPYNVRHHRVHMLVDYLSQTTPTINLSCNSSSTETALLNTTADLDVSAQIYSSQTGSNNLGYAGITFLEGDSTTSACEVRNINLHIDSVANAPAAVLSSFTIAKNDSTGALDTTVRGHVLDNVTISGKMDMGGSANKALSLFENGTWAGETVRNFRVKDFIAVNSTATNSITGTLTSLAGPIVIENVTVNQPVSFTGAGTNLRVLNFTGTGINDRLAVQPNTSNSTVVTGITTQGAQQTTANPSLGVAGSVAGSLQLCPPVGASCVTIGPANSTTSWEIFFPTSAGTANQLLSTGGPGGSTTWTTATYPQTTAAGNVLASSSANTIVGTATPTLGAVGTQGQLKLAGTTSGTVTQTTQAAAGTPTVTWGTATGTPAVTSTAPLAIASATGNLTCTTCVTSSGGGAMTGTAPVAVSAAGAVSITGVAGQVLGGSTPAFTATPTLGAVGTQGQIILAGSTSGTVTQTTPAAAGTPTITWGSSTGTPAVTATGPLAITAASGNIACATCATTTNGGALSGTSPVALSAAGAISITGAAGQVLAGSPSGFSATPTLGVAGTTAGNLSMCPVTGASCMTIGAPNSTTNWEMFFPTSAGSANQLLTTGGAGGATSWTSPSQLVGTATNDNASAGNIGEVISSTVVSGSAVALTTGTVANITSMSLTAGDWDVSGECIFTGGGTTTVSWTACSYSTTTAAINASPGFVAAATPGGGAQFNTVLGTTTLTPPVARFSLSATTTVFLTVDSAFGTSTESAYGIIRARRAR